MNRRLFLCGLVAAPAVVAIGSLMPIRGIVMPVGPRWIEETDFTLIQTSAGMGFGQPMRVWRPVWPGDTAYGRDLWIVGRSYPG